MAMHYDEVSHMTPSVRPSATAVIPGLRQPEHRVERRSILWWTLRVLLLALVVLGGLLILYSAVESVRPWIEPVLWTVAAIFAVNLIVMPTWRYLVHRWESTENAVFALKGWWLREWRIIPVSRIQSVDVVRGPLQQMLGLATLKVTTASPEGSVKIVGLDAELATRVAGEITAITQATPGDAT
jgi:membrane protein YdbS with pleckstrin-like domain